MLAFVQSPFIGALNKLLGKLTLCVVAIALISKWGEFFILRNLAPIPGLITRSNKKNKTTMVRCENDRQSVIESTNHQNILLHEQCREQREAQRQCKLLLNSATVKRLIIIMLSLFFYVRFFFDAQFSNKDVRIRISKSDGVNSGGGPLVEIIRPAVPRRFNQLREFINMLCEHIKYLGQVKKHALLQYMPLKLPVRGFGKFNVFFFE